MNEIMTSPNHNCQGMKIWKIVRQDPLYAENKNRIGATDQERGKTKDKIPTFIIKFLVFLPILI